MKTKTYHRRSIRLTGYDYTQIGHYFLTICTRNRECLFGEVQDGRMLLSSYGRMVNDCWQKIPNHFPQIVLHEYVIMPNHIHGIIEMDNNTYTNGVDASVVGTNVGTPVGANNYSPLQTPHIRHTPPSVIPKTGRERLRSRPVFISYRERSSPQMPVLLSYMYG